MHNHCLHAVAVVYALPTLLACRCCSLSLLMLWLIDADADADTNDANADADAGGHPAHRLKRKQSYSQTLTTQTTSNEAANDHSVLIEGRVYRFNPPNPACCTHQGAPRQPDQPPAAWPLEGLLR